MGVVLGNGSADRREGRASNYCYIYQVFRVPQLVLLNLTYYLISQIGQPFKLFGIPILNMRIHRMQTCWPPNPLLLHRETKLNR